jgi:hypothetical protein
LTNKISLIRQDNLPLPYGEKFLQLSVF